MSRTERTPPDDEALRELRADFRKRLPDRVGAVVAALGDARARPDEPERLAEARRLAHALKGTASSYGFAEIGASFEAVEEALGALAGSAADPRAAWAAIDAALARARAALG
ncbi:MAG: Hpt domain-containing protein [Proteobacteria bacterium]|nr:Hpt domain-containing protein [Pseudomonadota bacterium]